ncbi:MAG: hypothetical protein IJW19_05160 [Clostridia bacterium]|nr:hypothetical protein [Clostridia bacterium]
MDNSVFKTKEELKNGSAFVDKYDLMDMFKCGEAKALSIIRSVKKCTGDKLGIKGKVLVTELNEWMNNVEVKI